MAEVRGLRARGMLVACCVAGPALCFSQAATGLLSELQQSRKALPAFAARYEESLRVPRDQAGAEPQENQISWGGRDSDWIYEYGFGPNSSYERLIGDSEMQKNGWGSEVALVTGGTYYRSVSSGAQGAIAKRKPGVINPAGSAYELRMGEPYAEIPGAKEARSTGATQITIPTEHGSIVCDFRRFGKQLVVQHFVEQTGRGSNEVLIQEWIEHQGFFFPRAVHVFRRFDDKEQSITYRMLEKLPSPEKLLVWHGWKENAIVKDNATQIVYRYKGGKLVPDPLFNDDARTMLTWDRLAIVAAAALGCVWLIKLRLGKRRKAAP